MSLYKKSYPNRLREQLGLTLESFAMLINCSSGQLSMTESGKRNLPATSMVLLSSLEIAAMEAESSPPIDRETQDFIYSFVERQLKTLIVKKAQLELQLKNMEDKTSALEHFIKTAKVWAAKPLPLAKEVELMELLERKAQKKWKECCLEIAHLKIALAGIRAELEALEKMIKS